MLRTKDAAKIGTTTFRVWVRSWHPEAETWIDLYNGERENYDKAQQAVEAHPGEAAEITKVRWDQEHFDDPVTGQCVLDGEGVETERWYFYFGDKGWVLDEHVTL